MDISTLNSEHLETAANMLKAIAHPMRMAIVNLLTETEELTVTELHKKLNIEQSTTSHHLGILRDKGVLKSKRVGKNTFYSLKSSSLKHIVECVTKYSTL